MTVPAAPAAPAPSTTTPGTTPTTAPPAAPATSGATPSPAAGGNSAPRGPDGKFLPRAGDAGATAPPSETPAQAVARALRYKANGRDVEISEEEAIRRLQIGDGAKAKFTELDRREKELEARIQAMKEKPWELFETHGLDADELAFQRLQARITKEEMSPEQRRAAELDVREAKLKADEDARTAAAADAEQKAAIAQFLPIIQEHAPKALEAAGLPMIPAVYDSFHGYMRDAVEAMGGITPEAIRYAAEAAKQDATELHGAMTSGLKGKALADFLGPDVANELRRYDLQVFHEKRKAGGAPAPAKMPAPEPQPAPKRFLTEAEWRAKLKAAK